MNPELEARLRRFGASLDAAADAAEVRRAADPLASGLRADVSSLEPAAVPPRRQPHFYRVLAVAAAAAAVAIAVGVVLARSPAPDRAASPTDIDSSTTVRVAAAATGTGPATTAAGAASPQAPASSTSTAPTTSAAPASIACPSYRLNDTLPLRLCDKGDAVRAVQQRLRDTVAPDLLDDGYLGPTTEAAVRTFQRAHGLEVDGLVGPDTWSALFVATAETPDDATTAG
jgi:murein L,D-transpeptidase YcbB/YkuD